MAKGLAIKCLKCNYKISFLIGTLMSHLCDDLLETEYINEITKKHIENLIKYKGGEISFDRGDYIYICPECDEIQSEFYCKLNYDEGIFEPTYKCGKCDKTLKCMGRDINLENIKCPKCKNYSFVYNLESELYGICAD